jgi:FkbM family methyltransferase
MALIAYARWFPLRRGKLRIVNRLWRTAAMGRGTARTATLKYGGLKVPCDLQEMMQRQFFFFGTYFLEEEMLDIWTGFAERANVIFDVGANAGIYSLAALASRRQAHVHAFEPTPEIAARLRETARLNDLSNLIVHEIAVLDRSGTATLHRFRGDLGDNEGMNYIGRPDEPGMERVSTVRLDHFCRTEGITHIDLLKLDVQGHEHSVLLGAEGLIKVGRLSTIFMELNWAHGRSQRCSATDSIRLLTQHGYKFLNPRDRKKWQEPGDWMLGLSDIVAHHGAN